MNNEFLKQLRIDSGETRREVAIATGLTEYSILCLENGKNANPRLSTLKALSEHYGVEVGEFVSEEKEEATSD